MLHLLKIDLKKMTSYRTFWVVCGLYFSLMTITTASGMEVLKWLASFIDDFGQKININRIPLYHFPDVWQNLIFVSGLFKYMLAIMVIISITNEFQYRTIRQNIIDGMSRWEFLKSKILTNLLLSLVSAGSIFLIGFITGLIYSSKIIWTDIFTDLEFFPAYFLEVFAFLSYSLMLGIIIQRAGLTIILMLPSYIIEFIIRINMADRTEEVQQFFPMQSIHNLVPIPFMRYAFQEIQDYVAWGSMAIALTWTFLFNYFSYLKLKKSDI